MTERQRMIAELAATMFAADVIRNTQIGIVSDYIKDAVAIVEAAEAVPDPKEAAPGSGQEEAEWAKRGVRNWWIGGTCYDDDELLGWLPMPTLEDVR